MADGADLVVDTAKLLEDGDKLVRGYLTAGTLAVGGATCQLEKRLEEATRVAVPGRLWRAWASRAYPQKGPARDPVGTVFVNGGSRSRGAITFWSQPGRIVGRSGQWLAIPLPAAGSRGRARNLTPGEWERRTGKQLRFVYRGGRRSALLVADLGTTNSRTGVYRPITRARTAADQRRGFMRGEQSVPIFVLVQQVAFGNRVSLQPIIDRAGAKLTANVAERLQQLT